MTEKILGFDEEVADIEDRALSLPIGAKHEIMIQYAGTKKIDIETYAGDDFLSAAIKRTEELEQDPNVRFYVVILKIVGQGVNMEEIMMVRDVQSFHDEIGGILQ